MKCPICGTEMEVKTESVDGSVKIASANPGKGGHFGDSPYEYGSSGFGDLYKDCKVLKDFHVCSSCDHKQAVKK